MSHRPNSSLGSLRLWEFLGQKTFGKNESGWVDNFGRDEFHFTPLASFVSMAIDFYLRADTVGAPRGGVAKW